MAEGVVMRRGGGGPNMTPMVDVVLCILVFFMLGFELPEWLMPDAVPVERGVGTQKAGMPAVVGRIVMERRDGETWVRVFGEDWVKMEADHAALQELLTRKGAEISPEMRVVICPRGDVRYQELIWVYECCLRARMRQVAFAPAM